jgi:hypothetical protein
VPNRLLAHPELTQSSRHITKIHNHGRDIVHGTLGRAKGKTSLSGAPRRAFHEVIAPMTCELMASLLLNKVENDRDKSNV